jgi:DNA-binding CsgD family transcriptional regulator/tetratricopeptide (TPR) repeat protein
VVVRISSPEFVGRREELAALAAAVARASEGDGSAVLIAADAGIGKSRLIAEFSVRAQATGAIVVVGECLPIGESVLPYAPIVAALRALIRESPRPDIDVLAGPGGRELEQLLPELNDRPNGGASPAPSDGSRARLFEAFLAVLTKTSRATPVVLVIEDIHWADRSTRDFVAFLVRAARRERLTLIASYRSEELGQNHPLRAFLYELERSGRAVRIEVPPFTPLELREQVEAILGHPPARVLIDRLLERSEGNPFFTEELLASSARGMDRLPESLRDALLLRVESLPVPGQRIVRIAAAAGRTVDHSLLAQVAGLSDEKLARAIRDAVASHVLVHSPASTAYSFRHALVREAVYDDLLPAERRTLHLGLAHALGEWPELAGTKASAAAELAHHWHAAGELPEALVACVRAGMAAEEVHAFSEALVQYERALAIWDSASRMAMDVPLARTEAMRHAAEAAYLSGAMERAIELAGGALERIDEHADPVSAALVHERLGRYLWTAGHSGALDEYRRAVELVPPDPPSQERAFVLAAEAQALMLSGRTDESAVRCEEALAIARQLGVEALEAHVLNTTCGNLSTGGGDVASAVAAAAEARGIAGRLGLIEEIARSYINASDALDVAGGVDESIRLTREGIEVARDLGLDRHHGELLRSELAGRLIRSTRWKDADLLLRELVEREPAGVARQNTYIYVAYLHAERGESGAASGALERAEDALGHAERSAGVGQFTEVKATNELWSRRPEVAAEAVAACLGAIGGEESLFYTARVYELGARAHADVAARTPSDAQLRSRASVAIDRLLDRLDTRIARLAGMIPPLVRASRATLIAERTRIADLPDASPWREAIMLWKSVGNGYLAAYAQWRQAEALLIGRGDRRSVQSLVMDAHVVARDLDARPLREELETLARRARLDLIRSNESAETPTAKLEGFDLTPREIEVLVLLADGLTNREIAGRLFISDKTASVHVSHILGKLSVPNRAAAAATAHRLGVA